jgi:tRNA(adenine34) deaminase
MALEEAKAAMEAGEIPVGAVIVCGDELIARAHNRCERDGDATAHAERLAITEACRRVGHWRLSDCTLYVTLEPCPMCAGAAINARIGRVVFAARDPRMGACGSLLDLSAYPLEIRPHYESGLMEDEARELLRAFFARMRKKNKK